LQIVDHVLEWLFTGRDNGSLALDRSSIERTFLAAGTFGLWPTLLKWHAIPMLLFLWFAKLQAYLAFPPPGITNYQQRAGRAGQTLLRVSCLRIRGGRVRGNQPIS
jgi:hypothetical protein